MPDNNLVKILFRFYSEILDAETVETMWAEVVNLEKNYYKIANTPFYVPLIANGDTVWAEYSAEEEMLTFRKTIENGGNSTIHIIMMDKEHDIQTVREALAAMGCESEKMNHKYFALDVPAAVDYFPVKQKLNTLQKEGIIDYAETCLSANH